VPKLKTALPWSPATDELRNIMGPPPPVFQPRRPVTIWANTSTVITATRAADPNMLVKVPTARRRTSCPLGERFWQPSRCALWSKSLRGVSFTRYRLRAAWKHRMTTMIDMQGHQAVLPLASNS